jgi:hypothetical protein
MVSELYANDLRSRVLSAISGVWGVAALLGPIVGGLFAGLDVHFISSLPVMQRNAYKVWVDRKHGQSIAAEG